MRINGNCHCKDLTYEAEIDPKQISICHCLDCQILSGSAFRTAVRVKRKDFHLISGKPKRYTKISESGKPRVMVFCGNCGTQLYGTGTGESAAMLSLRIGTCNQRANLKPTRQIWKRSGVTWLNDMGIKSIFETGPQ